jgi:DNA-binding NarL/FixJ family response regulator
VIVKDWVMPGMDSIELTRQISKHSPDTAIVIFSFYDMLELELAVKAAGVRGVATKNVVH